MSNELDTAELDTCGCCTRGAEPSEQNLPGQSSLTYRIGTHGSFLERMLERAPRIELTDGPGAATRPLAGLATRVRDDFATGLMDAWACVADVFTFYQERIANEGYLRTATERRSVLELARAVGYELSPGVSASTFLTFTVENAQGSPGVATVPAGTQVKSIPAHGKLPQTFETTAPISARAAWNELRPRRSRRQDLVIYSGSLYMIDNEGSFGDGTADTVQIPVNGATDDVFRVGLDVMIDPTVGSVRGVLATQLYLSGTNSNLKPGDRLLFVGKNSSGATATMSLAIRKVVIEGEHKRTRIDFVSDPVKPRFRVPRLQAATAADSGGATAEVTSAVSGRAFSGPAMSALLAMRGLTPEDLRKTFAKRRGIEPTATDPGVFVFKNRLGFFGHNAPLYGTLPYPVDTRCNPPVDTIAPMPYQIPDELDTGEDTTELVALSAEEIVARTVDTADDDVAGEAYPPEPEPSTTSTAYDPYPINWDEEGNESTIWTTSQWVDHTDVHGYLERTVPELTRNGWVLLEATCAGTRKLKAYWLTHVLETSITDYAMTGRVTGVKLVDQQGLRLKKDTGDMPVEFKVRKTTAHVQSSRLVLTELPIDDAIEEVLASADGRLAKVGAAAVMLDGLVADLEAGQLVAVSGEDADAAGVTRSEVVPLSLVEHIGGDTVLYFRERLQYRYSRETFRINANVARANHGETTREVLGSGDSTRSNQSFTLRRPPLTYVTGPVPRGVLSTLSIRVNDVLWTEVSSLHEADGEAQVYMLLNSDDGKTVVQFGDGRHGARLPTGQENVVAHYRSGLGADGAVEAGSLSLLASRPLGIKSVSNPERATGAAAAETVEQARVTAPTTAVTLDRLVTCRDYELFARSFAGIARAQAVALWTGSRRVVHVTVAGVDGNTVDSTSDLFVSLYRALDRWRDPAHRIHLGGYQPMPFNLAASVRLDPARKSAVVLAQVRAALLAALSFDRREFGQPVTAAEVMAILQRVPGVLVSTLQQLYLASDETGPSQRTPSTVLYGYPARWADGGIQPAQLLVINPAGLNLMEMSR